MSEADAALRRIEAITDEIERLQRELGFPANQPSDRQARATASRILRRMAQNQPQQAAE